MHIQRDMTMLGYERMLRRESFWKLDLFALNGPKDVT